MFTSFYVNKKEIREKYTKDILDFVKECPDYNRT